MKLVKGTILSSKPISLSKASSVLTRFLSTETGAPPAVSTYLKRAAASIEELTRVHKEAKTKKARQRHKEQQNELPVTEMVEYDSLIGTGNPRRQELDAGKVRHSKKRHSKKKHKVTDEERGRDVDLINSTISLREEGFGYQKNSDGREMDEKTKKRKKMDRSNQFQVVEREKIGNSAFELGKKEVSDGRDLDMKTEKRKKKRDSAFEMGKEVVLGHQENSNVMELVGKTKKRENKRDQVDHYEILKGNDSDLIRGKKKRKLETEDAFEQTNHHKKKKRKNKNEN